MSNFGDFLISKTSPIYTRKTKKNSNFFSIRPLPQKTNTGASHPPNAPGLSPGARRSRRAEKQKRQRCLLMQTASFVLRVLQRLLRLLLPLRRRIAE
jgi:hypothetical protein